MNRRRFLAAVGAVATASASPLHALQATQGCFPVHAAKTRCVAGFAMTPVMPQQSCRALCWATCLAYMLRGYGADVSEELVLDRAGVGDACNVQNDKTRLLQAAGAWRDRRGRDFLVQLTELNSLHERHPQETVWASVLQRVARQPILCGAAGHTTLVTEIAVDQGPMVGLKRHSITVRDPWTRSDPLRALTEAELEKPFWVLALSIRPL